MCTGFLKVVYHVWTFSHSDEALSPFEVEEATRGYFSLLVLYQSVTRSEKPENVI